MKDFKKIIPICIVFNVFALFGQDYIAYQNVFNRIDQDILSNNLDLSSRRLDTIYSNYSFIYAKHCVKALQIACVLDDYEKADKWLKKAFLQGVPLWIIRNNKLTSKVFQNKRTLTTTRIYDSLHLVYKASINTPLAKTIDSLYLIDQHKTQKVNNGFFMFRHTVYGLAWLKNNKKQFAVLKGIIEKQGFPGERLIGLPSYIYDSASYYPLLKQYGPNIVDQRTFIMLLHCYSNPRESMHNLLLKNVESGYLSAYQFGAIHDFMARFGKEKNSNDAYYNVWHTDPNTEHNANIDRRRQAIGLTSLEEQKKKNELFLERFKNKTCNETLFME